MQQMKNKIKKKLPVFRLDRISFVETAVLAMDCCLGLKGYVLSFPAEELMSPGRICEEAIKIVEG